MLTNKKILTEQLITFNNKVPKYNNVAIVCGGTASGKNFIIENLLGINGKLIDVDKITYYAVKCYGLRKKFKSLNIDVDLLNLNNADDNDKLHKAIKILGLNKKQLALLYKVMLNNYKSNLIFSTTIDGIEKLYDICNSVIEMGYLKEDIHLIWVINDINDALLLNNYRKEQGMHYVKPEIVINKHELVNVTMLKLLNNNMIRKEMLDGDIWLVFNKPNIDSIIAHSKIEKSFIEPFNRMSLGGKYIENISYLKIKEKNKDLIPINSISKKLLDKIYDYDIIK